MGVIEPTQEYLDAFMEHGTDGMELIDTSAGIVAVAALIERDYQVVKRCGDVLVVGIACELDSGHSLGRGSTHETKTAEGNTVKWT